VADRASATTSSLVESPLLNVYDIRCRASRSGYGPVRVSDVAQIILPRRGAFAVAGRGSEPLLIDTSMALVFGDSEEYRVSHPGVDGDDCTVVVPSFDLHKEAIGKVRGRIGPTEPEVHLAVCLMTRALYDRTLEQFEAEEAALLLLATIARAVANGNPQSATAIGRSQRVRIEHVRALLAGSPTARWSLDGIARTVNCSPFHLARQFRAVTGETISRYVLRLRLDLALAQIAGGERDLSAVAFDTGFAHHSHFSARFHASFGITPSEARDALTKPRLEQLRLMIGRNLSRTLRHLSSGGTAALVLAIGLLAYVLVGAVPARAAHRGRIHPPSRCAQRTSFARRGGDGRDPGRRPELTATRAALARAASQATMWRFRVAAARLGAGGCGSDALPSCQPPKDA
jgi:AraC family transcriptional regulator